MMCKGRRKALAALLLLCTALAFALCARAEEESLLVLTDEAAGGRAAETAAELRSLAMYNNWKCTFAEAGNAVETDGFTRVVLCMDAGNTLTEETAEKLKTSGLPVFVIGGAGLEQLAETEHASGSVVVSLKTEEEKDNEQLVYGSGLTLLVGEGTSLGGEVYVGASSYPLCKTVGTVTHLAYFDAGNEALCAQLATLLQRWMWPYKNAPTSYGQYVVLDNVYPFSDPAKLMEISAMLEEYDMPYAVCAMPLYANAEYPAMKRFCEYLRYVQSKGCGVILHVPLITLANVEAAEVKRYMEMAVSGYVGYGVYPIALEAPDVWLQSEKGLSVLEGCRTVFLFQSDEKAEGGTAAENLARKDGHQLIAPAYTMGNAYTTAFAQAVYLDANEDVETLRVQVERLKNSRRAFVRLTDMDNIFYSGDHVISASKGGSYAYDNKSVSIVYEPFVYTAYTFDRGFAQYFTEQIETSNKFILIFVFLACGIFVTAIFLSRRLMRRELLRGGSKPSAPKEGGKK